MSYIMGQLSPDMNKEYTTLVTNMVRKYGFNATVSNENIEIEANVPWHKGKLLYSIN